MQPSTCVAPHRGFRLTLLALAGASAFASFAHDSVKTPGTPPGIVLPATAEVVPPAPAWDGVAYRKGVVSVSHPLAAKAGADVLARGGNAIDAAAAIQFMLNVVEPQFSGIGGGGFMMVHLAKHKRTFAIDGREKAPAAATPGQFLAASGAALPFATASTSGLAVGVPGTLAAVDTALRRYGTIKLRDAIAPATAVAEQGFRINRFLAANIACGVGGRNTLQTETAAVFCPGGVALKEGDLLLQPDLARALRLIAQQGPDVFYRGEIARAIIDAQQRSRTATASEGVGRMTLQDLANYNVVIRKPVSVNYRGWRVAAMSPPSSGGLTVGQMLLMLERFPIGDAAQGFGFGAPNTLHVMTEAMRLAFADRAVWMGDEDFVPVPKRGLLHPEYVATRSALISPTLRMATPGAGNPLLHDAQTEGDRDRKFKPEHDDDEHRPSHTTHFSVVDKWGNVVSFTTTIEATWGTGIMVPGYGFLLNNELTDFNFAPTFNAGTGNPGANDVAANKRPRSSMSPAIVFKGRKPVAAFGSPGGATIINSVFNVTLNLVDHGMSIQQAINAPRWSVTGALGTVSCEGVEAFQQPKISIATQGELRGRGHLGLGAVASVNACTAAIGSVQGVVIDLRSGRQYGGADPRREGTVIGLKPRKSHDHDHDD